MIFPLDWALFGNGRGMASPAWDDVFYWLGGRFYRWIGGLGAQLESYEWRAPPAGTRRSLFGHEFVIYTCDRRWMRVRCCWTLAGQFFSPNAERVHELHSELVQWQHGK